MRPKLLAQPQIHFLVSFFAATLLSWPLVQIAAHAGLWPLWCYVFGVWVVLIAVAVAFARAINAAPHPTAASDEAGPRT